MTETVKHSTMGGVNAHSIVRWEVADAAARDALAVVADDKHKVCFVTATATYFALRSVSPMGWELLGTEESNPLLDASLEGSTLTLTKVDSTTIVLELPEPPASANPVVDVAAFGSEITFTYEDATTTVVTLPEGYEGNAIEGVAYDEMLGGLTFTFRNGSTQTVELPAAEAGGGEGVALGAIMAASRIAPPEGFVALNGQEYDTAANTELANMFNVPTIEPAGAIEEGTLSISSNVMARNIQFQSSEFASDYRTLIPMAVGFKRLVTDSNFGVSLTEPSSGNDAILTASSGVSYFAERYSSILRKMASTGTVSEVTVSWGLYSSIEALYTVAHGIILANVSKSGAGNALIAIRESDGAVAEVLEGGWYTFGNSTRLLFSTERGLVLDNGGDTMYEVDGSVWPPVATAKPGLPVEWVAGSGPSGLSINDDTVYQTVEANGALYYALPMETGIDEYVIRVYNADTEVLVGETPPLTDVSAILHLNMHPSGLLLVSHAPRNGVHGTGLAAILWTHPSVGWEYLDFFKTPIKNSATVQCWHTGISMRSEDPLTVVAVGRDGPDGADRRVWRLALSVPSAGLAKLPSPAAPGQWIGWYVKAPAIAEPAPPQQA